MMGLGVAALSGCATYPISKNLRKQAGKASLAEVQATPAAYKGKIVIWGGRIIQTFNDTNGAAIYIAKLPLNRHEKPDANVDTRGRFVAHSPGFIDPAVFRRGRLVTVAGKVTGLKFRRIQKIKYPYPVLSVKELHLWPLPKKYYNDYYYGTYPVYPALWGWDWDYPDFDWDQGYPDDDD